MTKEEGASSNNDNDDGVYTGRCHLPHDVLDTLLDVSEKEYATEKPTCGTRTENESRKDSKSEWTKEIDALARAVNVNANPGRTGTNEADGIAGVDADISPSKQPAGGHLKDVVGSERAGAFSITAVLPTGAWEQDEEEEAGEDSTTANISSAFIAEAELVDEEEATAAQREIDRLRQELQELRETNQQDQTHQRQAAEGTLCAAVAVPIHRPETELSIIRTTANRNSQSRSNTTGSRGEASEELSIFLSKRKLDEEEKLDQLRAGRKSIKETLKQLTSTGLYGRDKEIRFLKECLHTNTTHTGTNINSQDESQQQQQGRKLVLIKAYSGVGKTSLALTLKETVDEQKGLFVVGKFGNSDLKLNEPYHGILDVCQGICTAIWGLQTSRSKSRTFMELHDKLSQLFDAKDIQLLTKVIPGLKKIMQFYSDGEDGNLTNNQKEEEEEEDQDPLDAKARLQYLFRVFVRLIASYFAPFVVVIDDLQWVDSGSLDLIKAVLTDAEESSFLVIGLYRSNEVEDGYGNALDDHILTSALNELKDTRNNSVLKVLELPLGNLNSLSIQTMLVDVLSVDTATNKVVELTELCYRRTNGNVHFFTSFLAMLEEERMLEYDFTRSQYRWEIDRIRSDTGATSNIVDLMKRKLTKLPSLSCELLSMAACLGSSFDRSMLELVWGHWRSSNEEDEAGESACNFRERLTSVVSEGFLESFDKGDSCVYRWIHDSLQEACYALIPKPASQFMYRVGLVLWQNLSEKELEQNVFLVANLLNERQGGSLEAARNIGLAELNFRATKKAFSCSAFQSAGRYAICGIEKLPADSWSNHYRLTLDLHSYAAEASELLGNYESMMKFCDAVLAQDIPTLDQVPVYSVLATQMANSNRHVDAVALLLKALCSLGIKFPKSNLGVLISTLGSVMKAKRNIKFRTQQEVATMPILHSHLELQVMNLIDKLITYSHLCGDDLCGLAILKSTQYTLKYGISEVSPTAFAAMATIFTGVLGDLQAGSMYGEYALHLARKLNSAAALSRTKFVAACFAFSWTKPFHSCCNLCLESYSEGMRCGDTETATFVIFCYIMMSCLAGRPLSQIEADCSIYSKQMKELKREQAYDYTLTVWQMVRNLMGHSQGAISLEGEILPDLEKFTNDHKDNGPMKAMIYSQQMRLYAMLGEYEQGAKLFVEHGYDWPKGSPGHPLFMDAVCSGGIAAFAMARQKPKYRKHAMKARATVKGWVRKGNPNVKHFDALFDAEAAALRKKRPKADRFYQSAIAMASRAGFTQDAALANERYGDFMLSVVEDEEEAAYYLKRAVVLYSEWGAERKVDMMQAKYADLLPRKEGHRTVDPF